MVGAEANLSFIDFLVNLGPLVLIFFGGTLCVVRLVSKGEFHGIPNADKLLEIDEWSVVENRKLFWISLLVLATTIIAFVVGGPLGASPALVALGSGIAMLLLSGVSPEKTLREIDWSTIFFFVGIFVALGGLERVGIFAVHNIVITATLIPIVRDLITMLGTVATPLWWTLVVGATLGGSMIPIGSVAGVIALGVAEREGYTISMKRAQFFILV